MLLSEFGFGAEHVAATVVATRGARVVHQHGPVTVVALNQMHELHALVGAVRANA